MANDGTGSRPQVSDHLVGTPPGIGDPGIVESQPVTRIRAGLPPITDSGVATARGVLSGRPMVRAMLRVESSRFAQRLATALRPVASAVTRSKERADLLRGRWLGHALHPVVVVGPLGLWAGATVLDLFAGSWARGAARRLVGAGVLAAVPAAVTGLAEFATLRDPADRVAAAHATTNTVALLMQLQSFRARGRGAPLKGIAWSLAGNTVASIGGSLGGHLALARHVASRHPEFGAPEYHDLAADGDR